MAWARIEGSSESHPKMRIDDLIAAGAIALQRNAIAHCAQHQTNGYIDDRWVYAQLHTLRAKQRRDVLARAIAIGLLEAVPAKTTRTLTVDRRGQTYTVTIGPYPADGFLVHDYLDFNPCAAEIDEQRRAAADRQQSRRERRRQQQIPWEEPPADEEAVA